MNRVQRNLFCLQQHSRITSVFCMSSSAAFSTKNVPSENVPSDILRVKKHYNDFLRLNLEEPVVKENLSENSSKCALVMINSDTMDNHLVRRLWQHCDYRICADGGANRLFDGMKKNQIAYYIPGKQCSPGMSIREHSSLFWRKHHPYLHYRTD